MFEDPSFFVALSFVAFCVVVYLWQGSAIRSAFAEQIQARMDPTHRAEQNYHALSDVWHQARHRIESVTHDVQDIHQHYAAALEQSLAKAKQREESWMATRKQDLESFHIFQQKQVDAKALKTVLDEFLYESA